MLFIVDGETSFSRAPSSRLFYMARALKEKNFKVEIIGRKGEKVNDLNVTQVGGTNIILLLRYLLGFSSNQPVCS